MKKWSILLALCLSACCVLSACAGDANSSAPANSAQQSAPVESTAAPTPSETPAESSTFKVGETATLGGWDISVTGFELSGRIDNGYSYFDPGEGNQFGIVSVSVTNQGTEAGSFLPTVGFGDDVTVKIIYNSQYEYSSTQLLAYDQDLHDEFLNPLSSASGVIAFELPDAVANGAEGMVVKFTSGGDSVEFTIR